MIKINKVLYFQAQLEGARNSRSVSEQINHWARFGKACMDNPELPTPFVAGCLEALEESRLGQFRPFKPRTES
jgi:hypothetical protein